MNPSEVQQYFDQHPPPVNIDATIQSVIKFFQFQIENNRKIALVTVFSFLLFLLLSLDLFVR